MSDIASLTRAYLAGTSTPRAVAEATLAAISADEPRLNAVATLTRDAALAAADRAGQAFAAGEGRGALLGIPVVVKDLFDMDGVATTFGADPVFYEHPRQDSTVVARLRAAGALIVAKSQLLEIAYGAPSPAVGQTNNPRDPSRTSGGSSGGSAALVAAGHVPVAVGTDSGGSIRIPAAYCGVVGMKPTWGMIDLGGAMPLSWTLDHAGPIAGSVADARTLLACLAARPMPRTPCTARCLRLGIIADHRDAPCATPAARASFARACAALRDAGAVLDDVSIPHLDLVSGALMLILLPEALAAHEHRLAHWEKMAEPTRLQLDAGAAIPAVAQLRARQFRTRMRSLVAEGLAGWDALLSPTVPFEAPETDPPIEADGGSAEMIATALANLVGFPAITIPVPQPAGCLPHGLHLTAGAGRDADLLDVAEAVESLLWA